MATTTQATERRERLESPLLDEGAAGEYLGGLSPRTLQRWRCERRGPRYIRLGKLARYRRSDLDAYIEAQARG
ncbi:MAG: helix-turn-helix domain-containing protein [Vicinamibacteria bacterium]|nr:helix-turn-helix domain-containing protein [Vicinamibacteria bacterium]